jgi:CRP-like cAMP-binding protein
MKENGVAVDLLSRLRSVPAFSKSTPAELSKLAPLFTQVRLKAGLALYAQGEKAERVFVLLEGRIRMEREAEDGRQVHLGELRAGDFFGFGEMFFEEYYIGTVAEEDSVLLAMKRDDFHLAALAVTGVRNYVMESLAHLARRSVWMLDWVELDRQLRYLLFWLCKDKSAGRDGLIEIPREYTHDRIARMLNASREHVSRCLKNLRVEGVLSPGTRRIVVRKVWTDERKLDPAYDPSLWRYFNID